MADALKLSVMVWVIIQNRRRRLQSAVASATLCRTVNLEQRNLSFWHPELANCQRLFRRYQHCVSDNCERNTKRLLDAQPQLADGKKYDGVRSSYRNTEYLYRKTKA